MARCLVSFRFRLSRVLKSVVLVLLLVGLVFVTQPASQAQASGPELQADVDWGAMPLYFIANQGQLEQAVDYYVQGADKTLYFTPGGLTFSLAPPSSDGAGAPETPAASRPSDGQEGWTLKLDYLGARGVTPQGQKQTEAVISYFEGSSEDWHTAIPTYSAVVYPGLWEGIDLKYSGTQDQLKQEFLVAPGADVSHIRLAYRGASISLNARGELQVSTPVGGFTDAAPVAYQEVEGVRVEVPVRYRLDEPRGSGAEETTAYGFAVGDYDQALPLVIDPAVLVYCGYIGGSGSDVAQAIAVDSAGCAYVTGYTLSTKTTFPVKVGPDPIYTGGADAFVAKVNAAGTGLVYCGYIGGWGDESGRGIAVDGKGFAYVTGDTESGDTVQPEEAFPVTVGPDTTYNGGALDAFVAMVDEDGTRLIYCGYVGGSGNDSANAIAVDGNGFAYITGWTGSTEATFPVTAGSDITYNGGTDAFVARVTDTGTGLDYCGYVGGDGADEGWGIAVDSSRCAYITGRTDSSEATFPVTAGPDTTCNGGRDVFVAKLDDTGSKVPIYCGYIGGDGPDDGRGIAVDSSGCAYVTGATGSVKTFPVTAGPDITHNGGTDAFVAKVGQTGDALAYCGYIGGSGYELGRGIAVDSGGRAFVVGDTSSSQSTFPVTAGPDITHNGGADAFVAKVGQTGDALAYCGYIGGGGSEYGLGIAVDSGGRAFVAGYTTSPEPSFPVTAGPDATYNGGYSDAYVAKISVPTVSGLSATLAPSFGGTEVIITGTDFTGATSVTFGGAAAPEFNVDSDTQITAKAPAHAAGVAQVRVNFAYGYSGDTPADDFTYFTPNRYQQDDTRLTYLGCWTAATNTGWMASANSFVSTDQPGATVVVRFTGTDVGLILRTAPWYGTAKVTLDAGTPGAQVDTIDLYSSVVRWKVPLYAKTGLGSGLHSLLIERTGTKSGSSGGTAIGLDAIDVVGTLLAADPLTKIDDKDATKFTYTAAWKHWDNSGYWAAYQDTYAYTDKKGESVSFTFSGTAASWVSCTSNTKGKARVTLDPGTPVEKITDIDLYSPTTVWKKTVYTTGLLDSGNHTIVIECLYEKVPASWWYTVAVDRFDILASSF